MPIKMPAHKETNFMKRPGQIVNDVLLSDYIARKSYEDRLDAPYGVKVRTMKNGVDQPWCWWPWDYSLGHNDSVCELHAPIEDEE